MKTTEWNHRSSPTEEPNYRNVLHMEIVRKKSEYGGEKQLLTDRLVECKLNRL